ncbi:MAG: MoaD/ThiS family protein [Chloroflexi bacterium]|nr:MoaD/ThiS family protein [Chloroflexota bacterium]
MGVTIRIPGPLRRVTNGAPTVQLEAANVQESIDALEGQFPGIKERLCDENGDLRYFVNIYLNGEDVRFLQGVKTPIATGDELSIVPAVAGGR